MSAHQRSPFGGGPAPSRRTFVKGMAVGGVAAGLGLWKTSAWAQTPAPLEAVVLSGTEFDLRISEAPINITGKPRVATLLNGTLPAPTLRWREGDSVSLRVANALDEETSIHWHGVVLPANMDGVPGISFHGIHPGGDYLYRFNVRQSGTYWYHAHSGFQEQRGLYGAIIIDPREPEPFRYDREHVVLLSDWTDEQPERVFSKLKKRSDYYNLRQRTLADFVRDVRRQGLKSTLAERRAWGQMRMNAADLADVTGSTYTYLLNGQAPASNWTGLFRSGDRVRLRLINGSAMTYFDVRLPGLKMTVVAADGQYVHPVTVDELRIAVAETFDVIVEPSGQDAFTIFAQAMDRTGYAAGTLAVREGLRAAVPELDARPFLTLADVGHDMGAMTHAPAADPHAGHVMPETPAAPADPHAGHAMPAATAPTEASAGWGISAPGGGGPSHPASEAGNALVDMQATAPTSRFDDPGIGLRNNGRRVLTYGDLQSLSGDPDGREPGRTIDLHLTGHMQRFVWSFNGVKFSSAQPLRLTYGERLRIVIVNDSMMSHPVHLHGMWSDVEDDNGRFQVRKHTVDVPPGSRRSFRIRADALGRWALHCHLLYHMEAGMMREVRVDEEGTV